MFIDLRKSVLIQPDTYKRLREAKKEDDTFDTTINILLDRYYCPSCKEWKLRPSK